MEEPDLQLQCLRKGLLMDRVLSAVCLVGGGGAPRAQRSSLAERCKHSRKRVGGMEGF